MGAIFFFGLLRRAEPNEQAINQKFVENKFFFFPYVTVKYGEIRRIVHRPPFTAALLTH